MALSTTQIQNAYVAFFNRPADVAGLTYWGNYAGSAGDLLNTFAQSAEYNALYKGMNNTQLVNAVYQNLFGRSPDVAGLNYWVSQLDSGKVTIGNAANTIQTGAQGTDKSIIDNKVAAATAFTTALDTTAEIVGYAGASSATLGQVKAWLSTVTDTSTSLEAAKTGLTALTGSLAGGTNEAGASYVLTTAQDVLTGSTGNDNFRAVAGNGTGTQDQTTLNSSDIVDGSTGTDALIVNLVGGDYKGGARVKNIETLQIGTNDLVARTFDYNVNAGSNEVTEVTTIVADQINVGEKLTVTNILKTGSAIPTLKWDNEANSTAGTFAANFRDSAVSGDTEVKLVLDDVKALNSDATTGRFNLGTGSNASVETLRVVSQGTTANTLNASENTDGTAVDLVGASTDGSNDSSALKTVIVEGAQAFGKAATVVTDTTNTSFGLTNRAVANDLGLDNTQASASNLVSLAATVTTLDASAATGDTNIRFTSRVDAAEVNVTYKGGKANDYVEFQQGNINATGGDGNDTFAFVNTQNNSTLTTADSIVGGAGTDTLQMGVNGSGTYNLDTTEFNNKSGLDVLDLRGNVNSVRLADAFVGAADAGLTVRTDKIVQTSDTSTANSTTATSNNSLEEQSTNTLNLTALSANRAVDFIGGAGSDRIVVNEVSLNSNVKLDGGTNNTTSGRFDTITVQDSAVLSRGDLANVKNFEGIVLVKSDTTSARQYTVEVTEAFLNANGNSKVLQIGTINAANQNKLTAADTVTIDVSDLLVSSNATFKTTGYDRKIDVTSLTAAGATVNFTANGGTITQAALQGLGLVTTTADAKQADILASVANQGTLGTVPSNGQNGNTIKLTGTAVVTNAIATGTESSTTFLSNSGDTITAGTFLNGSSLIDPSTTDTDVLTATLSAATTTPTLVGIETLKLTALASQTLALASSSGYKTLEFASIGTSSPFTQTITGLAGSTTLNLANGSLGSISSTLSTATDAISYALNGGTITALSDNGTGAHNIAVNAATTVTTLTTGANATLTVTGSGALTITSALAGPATVVNASAATGALTVTASGTASTIIGGAGNDSITGGAQADSLLGGAGNDTIDASGAGADTVRGGAGNDTIKLGGAADDFLVFEASAAANGADTLNGVAVANAAGNSTQLNFQAFVTGRYVDNAAAQQTGDTAIANLFTFGSTNARAVNNAVVALNNTTALTTAQIAGEFGTGKSFGVVAGQKTVILEGDATGANRAMNIYYVEDANFDGAIATSEVVLVGTTSASFDLDTIFNNSIL